MQDVIPAVQDFLAYAKAMRGMAPEPEPPPYQAWPPEIREYERMETRHYADMPLAYTVLAAQQLRLFTVDQLERRANCHVARYLIPRLLEWGRVEPVVYANDDERNKWYRWVEEPKRRTA
jgi:hypothetical protein